MPKQHSALMPWLAIAAFVSLMFWRPVQAQSILIIHSYSPELTWVKEINAGLLNHLSGKYDLAFHYMYTKQVPESQFPAKRDEALEAFRLLKPDIVIACDDNALRLTAEQITRTTPLVFCGINGSIRRDYPEIAASRNLTGVLERPLIKRLIIEMNRATGMNARKSLVLLGKSPTANAFVTNDLNSETEFNVSPSHTVDVLQVGSFEDWQQAILSSKNQGYDFIVAGGHFALRDKGGDKMNIELLNSWLGANAPIPVFTGHSQAIGSGKAIGGMVVDGELMGADTAQLAEKVLSQTQTARTIPFVTQTRGRFIFSTSGLAKWKLNLHTDYASQATLVP